MSRSLQHAKVGGGPLSLQVDNGIPSGEHPPMLPPAPPAWRARRWRARARAAASLPHSARIHLCCRTLPLHTLTPSHSHPCSEDTPTRTRSNSRRGQKDVLHTHGLGRMGRPTDPQHSPFRDSESVFTARGSGGEQLT
jgi:hypothetical protein